MRVNRALLSSFVPVTLAALLGACSDPAAPNDSTRTSGTGGGAGVMVEGLTGQVDAKSDEHGIVHLSCVTDDDCFAALGYVHAQNRFFFMDFVRNFVRGRLGSLVKGGDVVLERDYANRQFFATADGEPLEQKLYDDASPETRGHLDAYTRGVNAWLEAMRVGAHGATLTTEYDFALIDKSAIRDWEPADSAAIGLYVLDDLSNNSAEELALAKLVAAYDGPLAADLFSGKPVFDAFTKPLAKLPPASTRPKNERGAKESRSTARPGRAVEASNRVARHREALRLASERMALVGAGSHGELPGEIGSNNWAVMPKRTRDGHALLANDPHLPLSNPSIWFPVELDAKSKGSGEFHVAGSTFPGLPAVMVGHNEKIGWGVTTAYWDLADVYLEELTPDGKAVLFEGKEVPIVEKTFSFEDIASGKTIDKVFRWVPHHGPLVGEDPATHTGVSIRWVGHAGGTDLDGFYAVAKASSVDEAKKGIESICAANQNFVVVDVEGHLGWFPFGKLPNRPFASAALPPWLPLPADGRAEWDGVVPTSAIPQLLDPSDGQVATANQDMTGASADGDMLNDGQDALQAWSKADGARQRRILDLLAEGKDEHTSDTLVAMQADTFSLVGKLVASAVLDAAKDATASGDEKAVLDALGAWDGSCPTGLDGSDPVGAKDSQSEDLAAASIGCTAAHALLYAVVDEAMKDESKEAGTPIGLGLDFSLVLRALSAPESIASGELVWDDVATTDVVETRNEILLRALARAAEGLAGLGEPNAWRWGRVHSITLRSIFDGFGIGDYNDGPHAAPGGFQTVNVANPRKRALSPFEAGQPFEFAAGPSIRFVVEARPDGPRMRYQLPGGADLHRDSPFYNNLLPRWLEGEPIEFPFGPGAVTSPALELTLSPKG